MLSSVGCVSVMGAQPTDSLPVSNERADTLSAVLNEVSVTAIGTRKVLGRDKDGNIDIYARLLHEQTGLAGSSDPITLLKTLPSVATSSELKASLNIRGSHNGSNLFYSDEARVVNPMHMLGLYSNYNSSFYSNYIFSPSWHPASAPNATSAIFRAFSPSLPSERIRGEITAGVIESHGAIHLPLFKNKGLLSVGARMTYLNLLFPDILTLGTSRLKYDFYDLNFAYTHFLNKGGRIKASFFTNKDNLKIIDRHNGSKDGRLGWGNIVSSISWVNNTLRCDIGFSRYENSFKLIEAGRMLNLPSSMTQIDATAEYSLNDFNIAVQTISRKSSGQRNSANKDNIQDTASTAFEGSIAGDWNHYFAFGLDISAGIRCSLYSCNKWISPNLLPRIRIGYKLPESLRLYISGGRYMKFDRMVETSTVGLPADFYINSDQSLRPEEAWSGEFGIEGKIPLGMIDFSLELYARRLLHCGEYVGSILDQLNPDYSPLSDIIDGKGYAYGLSVSLSRQFGSIRGRVGYNIGKSRLKFDRYGNEYFPASHDRLHDLSASLLWNPISRLTLGATFTHATGTPFTKARYGYILGENLICEYYPHNSSRLPAYNRLDLSAIWRMGSHSIEVSVYNALGSKNILFLYYSYSLSEGIKRKESVMKTVIPSISYTFIFK